MISQLRIAVLLWLVTCYNGSVPCVAQSTFFQRDTLSTELYFGMTPSEIARAYPIIIDVIPENLRKPEGSTMVTKAAGNVLYGGDTLNLRSLNQFYDRGPVNYLSNGTVAERYVLCDSASPDLFVALDFFEDRLYRINIYGKGERLINEMGRHLVQAEEANKANALRAFFHPLEGEINRGSTGLVHLRSTDEVIRTSAFLGAFSRNKWNNEFVLWLEDTSVNEAMPGWCGNDRRQVSWEGFSKALARAAERCRRKQRR
jgi:hypothetical protein